MDGFEFNKIAGAVLAAMLTIFGGNTLSGLLSSDHGHAKPGYTLPVTKASGSAAATAVASAGFDFKALMPLFAKADASAGAAAFKKCTACHTPDKGGPNRVGPNLFGVAGRDVAKHAGFAYSPAMTAKGGKWTWEALAAYINDPRGAIPGNKMAFAGVKDNAELVDLLAFVGTLAEAPVALPK